MIHIVIDKIESMAHTDYIEIAMENGMLLGAKGVRVKHMDRIRGKG